MTTLNLCFYRRLSLKHRSLLLLACVLTGAVCLFILSSDPVTLYHKVWSSPSPLYSSENLLPTKSAKSRGVVPLTSSVSAPSAEHARCDDVMGSMTQGRWERLAMTPSDVQRMTKFHKHVREVEHGMPRGLQRQDGLCGNLSFQEKDGEHPKWFRALCDAEGDNPCCYHNRCVNRATDQCACSECYDMRNPLHAEYAKWRPTNKHCQVQEMSVEEICGLLKDATLYFIGDSFVRHIFTALLMAVRGNDVSGAFSRKIPQDLKSECAGIYMFTEKKCRLWVDTDVRVCPGRSTHLQYFSQPFNSDIRRQVAPLYGRPRSLVLVGMGFHGKLQAQETFRKVMQPLIRQRNPRAWPQLVWSTVHHWGVLKNPNLPNQSVQHVWQFNEKMKEQLRGLDVAVLDSFNMTAGGVESFDGSHYGYGVNRVKVQILLNFLKELRLKKKW